MADDKINSVNQTLYFMSRADEEQQTQTLANNHKLSYINLVNYPILGDVLNIIPEEDARANMLISYAKTGHEIKIATYQPESEQIKKYLNKLREQTGLSITLSICSKSSFAFALGLYQVFAQQTVSSQKLEISQKDENQYSEEIKNLSDLKDKISKVSTSNLLNVIFAGAAAIGASDIHLEPETENTILIRYRVDGVLTNIAELPIITLKTLSSRIKYLSKLKIDITKQPQDGRFDAVVAGENIDIRVSIIPAGYGESIVMRLLPRRKRFITLQELGFNANHLKLISEAISKPHGIIFNTGPTGSGKTTTLYAILTTLNKPGVKIMTLEDPIEYRIKGVDQTQINLEKGYDFASGLRALLRQDPDIMMVGEVRDSETAKIAIQAAITGHLVLTTLHTNNAAGAIPRLLDMNVETFLLGGSINLIIAQRLVRKICIKCRGKKCDYCNHTGYKGRIAIAEMLKPSPEIEQLVRRKGTLSEFARLAKEQGMVTMLEDGMAKVRQGLTTEEEILRVTRE